MQQKPVQLRLWQGVSAFLLDGVLRRHDQIQLRQLIGLSAYRDLSLGHGLQQRRLHFCRRPVHLVRQDQIMKQGALLKVKGAILGAVDLRPG